MKKHIISSLLLTLITLIFFGVVYTAAVTGVAWLAAPNHGSGQTVTVNAHVAGYALVGQKFTDDKYFWSRPSAVDYNAAGSGGSNKGPSNPDYLAQVQARIDTFLAHNPDVKRNQIPSELVTASGSGLDPDISPAAALVQVNRIAAVRKINTAKIIELVNAHTDKPLLGPEKINVLQLNIALNDLK